MSIKVIRYRLPSYWACPLINDDYTGLMITERIEKYEKRMSYDKGKLNN